MEPRSKIRRRRTRHCTRRRRRAEVLSMRSGLRSTGQSVRARPSPRPPARASCAPTSYVKSSSDTGVCSPKSKGMRAYGKKDPEKCLNINFEFSRHSSDSSMTSRSGRRCSRPICRHGSGKTNGSASLWR